MFFVIHLTLSFTQLSKARKPKEKNPPHQFPPPSPSPSPPSSRGGNPAPPLSRWGVLIPSAF
ncbi:hypothetical protein HYC85_014680 [Camellia sinensis]|uniref:Uncharacterized protein n=1 Tax=Camellia sinensis TaxID=4442 RepID=A0A7J7H6X3_CAMSI|nr:hypothetical protein HYC85_014680 [Camellia sinensis]